MPKVTYVLPDGSTRSVDVAVGTSVMAAAIQNNIRGIDAECGGCLSCATCHVYVNDDQQGKLVAPDELELEMLEIVAAERHPTSRLSCQIVLGDDIQDLVVRIPPRQA